METNKKLGNHGMSLVEILVAMGLISISAMAIAQNMLIMAKTQRTASIQNENRDLYDRVSRTLASEETCSPSLVGESAQGEVAVKDPLVATTSIARGGVTKGAGWSLSSVALGSLQKAPGSDLLYRGSLTVVFARNSAVFMGSPELKKTIQDIYFTVSDPNSLASAKIVRCFGSTNPVTSAKSNCSLIGGTWDETREPGTQCQVTLASNTTPIQLECQMNSTGTTTANGNAIMNADCNGINNGILKTTK